MISVRFWPKVATHLDLARLSGIDPKRPLDGSTELTGFPE